MGGSRVSWNVYEECKEGGVAGGGEFNTQIQRQKQHTCCFPTKPVKSSKVKRQKMGLGPLEHPIRHCPHLTACTHLYLKTNYHTD